MKVTSRISVFDSNLSLTAVQVKRAGARLLPNVSNHWCSGFTLVEAMVVVSIVAILAAIATPSLIDSIAQSRVTGVSEDFVRAINRARSEAVTRAIRVSVAPNVKGKWATGWSIFVDQTADGNGGQAPANDSPNLITYVKAVHDSVSIAEQAPAGQVLGYVSFASNGEARRAGGAPSPDGYTTKSFAIQASTRSRCISIIPPGVSRASEGACP